MYYQPINVEIMDSGPQEYNMNLIETINKWTTKQIEIKNVTENLELWKEVQGWFSEGDVAAYRSLVESNPNGKMIELGTWKGRSLSSVIPIAKAVNYSEVVAVDTFKGSPGEINYSHKDALYMDIRAIFDRAMQDVGAGNMLTVHEDHHQNVVDKYSDEYFDLVFIDAEHGTTNVIDDIKLWLPKVKVGGYIAGHDYDWPDVSVAVQTCFPIEQIHHFSSCWWVLKS